LPTFGATKPNFGQRNQKIWPHNSQNRLKDAGFGIIAEVSSCGGWWLDGS